MEWMSHRKQKATKQQRGTSGPGNILGCCLVSLRFLCDIHSIHSVISYHKKHSTFRFKKYIVHGPLILFFLAFPVMNLT